MCTNLVQNNPKELKKQWNILSKPNTKRIKDNASLKRLVSIEQGLNTLFFF